MTHLPYFNALAAQLAARWHTIQTDERGEITEKTAIVLGFTALAVTAVGIIGAAVLGKLRNLDLGN